LGVSPSVTLKNKDGSLSIIHARDTLKWLGVLFDRSLKFTLHIKAQAGKAEKSLNGLKMLSNTV